MLMAAFDFDDFWGKWDVGPYPLINHLYDTSAAFKTLWEIWVHEHLKEKLLEGLGGDNKVNGLLLMAGLHDVGKISPVFQMQLRNPDGFEQHSKCLQQKGYEYSGLDFELGKKDTIGLRHERASKEYIDKSIANSWQGLCALGHHGRWKEKTSNCSSQRLNHEGSELWQNAARLHVEHLTLTFSSTATLLCQKNVPVLTGLLCLSDWLASDQQTLDHTRSEKLDYQDTNTYMNKKREHFEKTIDSTLGLHPTFKNFKRNVFPFDLTATQKQMKNNPANLDVLAIPTGHGKTEAALLKHANLQNRRLYFALPTMATADVMFERIKDFYSESLPGETVTGQLVHSKSKLNSFYSTSSLDKLVTGTLEVNDWFTGKRRKLLAPVTVCTVDQLLQEILRNKYNFVGQAAIMNSHVVFDETHSYDPYMENLFYELLRTLGHYNTPTTILSATLKQETVRNYFKQYLGSSDAPPTEVSYPAVYSTSETGIIKSTEGLEGAEKEIAVTLVETEELEEKIVCKGIELATKNPTAKIGIIVNQIDRCQSISKVLAEATTHSVHCIHSRHIAHRKQKILQEVQKATGKNSPQEGHIVVATQIVEQSVDLDFDFLLTELAPIAAIIQRLGRLWRHKKRRVSEQPECYVYTNLEPGFFSSLPYPQPEIYKAKKALQNLPGEISKLRVPQDVQQLVDSCVVSWEDLNVEATAKQTESLLAGVQLQQATAADAAASLQLLETYSHNIELGLEKFTEGSGEDGTRWITTRSKEYLVVGGDGLPEKEYESINWKTPTKENMALMLNYTVKLSGKTLKKAEALEEPSKESLNYMLNNLAVIKLPKAEIQANRVLGVTITP